MTPLAPRVSSTVVPRPGNLADPRAAYRSYPQPTAHAPEADPALPPLQNRTPEQLKQGMVVNVKGAGADDLAVARLIQDGAAFMAKTAGTTMGLKDVDINDRSVDNQGALGMATFNGNKGWFGLSVRSTKGIMDGIKLLRTTPFEQWTEAQRQSFVQSNETILHESDHVTLPAYDSANINAWYNAPRSLEEGLTEVNTMAHIGDFMREEFGVELPPMSDRISQSVSAYTRFTERLSRLIHMGTDGSADAYKQAAAQISDNVRADLRERAIAERITANLGGPGAPKQITDEIARTIDGFVDEQNGTRTKLMELQAALVDFHKGAPVNVDALLADMRALDRANPAGVAPAPRTGTSPIADRA